MAFRPSNVVNTFLHAWGEAKQRMTSATVERTYSTDFDWAIYADATMAGLAPLIPIPFVDSFVEDYFRRRMPGAIAQRHDQTLRREAVRALNGGRWRWRTLGLRIVTWPIRLLFDFLLRFMRKFLYFLTVKRAIDALDYYWRRAFLLDHMVSMGYLSDPAKVDHAVTILERVLAQGQASPLRRLASQLLATPWRVARTAWRAWRGRPDPALAQTRARITRAWMGFGDYFATLAQRYDETYRSKTEPSASF